MSTDDPTDPTRCPACGVDEPHPPPDLVQWRVLPEYTQVHLPSLIATAFQVSTSEARRGLAFGAVKLDGATVPSGTLDVPAIEVDGRTLQLGKRRSVQVKVQRGDTVKETYSVQVKCSNCGEQGRIEILKGTPVPLQPCLSCGCMTLRAWGVL